MRRMLMLGRALALTAGVLAIVLAGSALASSSQKTITACVHHRGGGLYLGRCARGDQTLSWDQRGPAGPRGPQGPAGPAALAINNDDIPLGTTMQLWTSGTETLSLGCGNQNISGRDFTGIIVSATEQAAANGFVVTATLNNLNPAVRTLGAPVAPGLPADFLLSPFTSERAEGQLEIDRVGVGAAVWTFSFHEHTDSTGNCHIQATIFPARS